MGRGCSARSPAALAGFRGLQDALAQGRLSASERCLVGLAVAQRSGSSYALSLQTRLAQQAGLTTPQILAAREGCADSDREVGLLFFAGKLVINRGELAEADLAAARQAGLSDSEILEVILQVALNLTAASVSHAARLKLDFPPAPPLPAKAHAIRSRESGAPADRGIIGGCSRTPTRPGPAIKDKVARKRERPIALPPWGGGAAPHASAREALHEFGARRR